MAFAFVGSNNAAGSGVTSLTLPVPGGVAVGDLLVAVFAFEGVGATSGPWITPNVGQFNPGDLGPGAGWQQASWQAPSGTGVGIEVWVAVYGSGIQTVAHMPTAQNVVGVMGAWSGEYNPSGNISGAPPRVATAAQVTGNQPAAPSVDPNAGELVIACAGDLMTAAKFGTPSGFTNRVDVARGAAGTVEATLADSVASVAGATGPITFPNAAASSSTLGATATLLVVPQPTTVGAGGVIDVPLPEGLDIGDGYTIRVTALDPTTGATVAGVNVGTVVLTAGQGSTGVGGGGGGGGAWFLVPGPGA